MVRRKITDEEKIKIAELHNLGKSKEEITDILGWEHKNAVRSVQRQITNLKKSGDADAKPKNQIKEAAKTLDELTRDERYIFLKSTLEQTPRFKMAFDKFTDDEKLLFITEYLNIVKSTDTLTEAEEQALFSAIMAYTLAFRSLGLKRREEDFYDASMDGEYEEDDPQFRRFVDPRFQKEYELHMNRYETFMKSLKMSRDQRLKDVVGQRRSLTDLAEELSSQSAQADVVTEVERLSKMNDIELKAMLDKGFLFGDFKA